MFIDYLPLMLMNMAAGLMVLAGFIVSRPQGKEWAPAFLLPGAIALICGLHMTFTWPLPGSYNVAFGELSVLFGGIFLAAGFAIAKNSSLIPLGIYAIFAGATAYLVGFRIAVLGLTAAPLVSGLGFVLTGLSGLLILPVFYFRTSKILKLALVVLLVIAAMLWTYTGCMGYWGHLEHFAKYKPATMR